MDWSPFRKDEDTATMYHFEDCVLHLTNSFVLFDVDDILPHLLHDLQQYSQDSLIIDLNDLQRLDSAGVVVLNHLRNKMSARGIDVEIRGGSESIRQILKTFTIEKVQTEEQPSRPNILEKLGDTVYKFFADSAKNFFLLMADVFYWSIVDLFGSKSYRKGEFVNQSVLIGASAAGIVTAMAFLIGAVMALQSSAQLRQFGANLFIVDLVVISMLREMGPLITAIVVAGRSGSAIASEIATMKITEELDGLTTMALNPIRFIVVPKMYAGVFTMPFLTIMANIVGILGGIVVAFFYLDITPAVFLSRMEEALIWRDLVIGFIKSLVFAVIIVLTGSFFGFRAERGATDVGRVTTSSVVVAISLVIVADSILGIIFY